MPEKLTSGPRVGYDLSRVGAGVARGPGLKKNLVAAAWSGTWPAPGSTLDLDFANDRGWVRGVGQGRSMDAVTFTRASTGRYIDSTGTLVAATDNVPRFDWASTATVAQRNLFIGTSLVPTSLTRASATGGQADPVAGSSGVLIIPSNASSSNSFTYSPTNLLVSGSSTASIYAKQAGFSRLWILLDLYGLNFRVVFNLTNGTYVSVSQPAGASISSTNIGSGWYRCVVTIANKTVIGENNLFFGVQDTDDAGLYAANCGGDGINGIYVAFPQYQSGSTATDYQPIAQPTITTPLRPTATCNGLLIEESRANRILWCRDATQSGSWTVTNVTAAKDQTGIDGVANAASSLTASADGGTCIQTITLASGSRTGSVYLKRLTGTGKVYVGLDGSTWSEVDLSDTEWRRIVLSGTVTNPVVAIKLATNGDAVAMDYAQVEDGLFATSPVLTTTASATRAVDLAEIAGANFAFFRQQEETTAVEFVGRGATAGLLVNGSNIGNLQALDTLVARHANGSSNLDTVATYALGSSAKAAVSGNRARRSISMNGSVAVTNNQPVRTTAVTNIRIGANAISIKRASVFPFAVSDSALQELTR